MALFPSHALLVEWLEVETKAEYIKQTSYTDAVV